MAAAPVVSVLDLCWVGDGDLFSDLRCQFGGGRVHVFFL